MNKKGFTLIEILAVIVLIGLLFGLAVPGINKISSNIEKKKEAKVISLAESAGILWGQDNKTRLRSTEECNIDGEATPIPCAKISIEYLTKQDYYETNSDKYDDYCIYVYKKNNRIYAKYNKDEVFCNRGPKITANDNVSSGNWHNISDKERVNGNIKLEFAFGNNIDFEYYYWFDDNATKQKEEKYEIQETKDKIIYVEACKKDSTECSITSSYRIKADFHKPTITLTKTTDTKTTNTGLVLDSYISSVTDNYSTLTKSNVTVTGTVGNTRGNYVIKYNVTDNAGNKSDEKKLTITITTPPSNLQITANDNVASGNWHNKKNKDENKNKLTFTATDATNYICKVGSSGTESNCTSPYEIPETSSSVLYVKACNTAGCTDYKTYTMKADYNVPTISKIETTNEVNKKSYKFTMNDTISGIGKYKITTDTCEDTVTYNNVTNQPNTYELNNTFDTNGTYKICVKDEAGNTSNDEVNIDIFEIYYYFTCSGGSPTQRLLDCTGYMSRSNLVAHIITNKQLWYYEYDRWGRKTTYSTGYLIKVRDYESSYSNVKDYNDTTYGRINEDGRYEFSTRYYWNSRSYQDFLNTGYYHYVSYLYDKEHGTGYNYYNIDIKYFYNNVELGKIHVGTSGGGFFLPNPYRS